jgi:tetratricopeptide (TPR) repeat protein
VTHDPREGARRIGSLLDRAKGVDAALLGQAWRDLGACFDVAGDPDRAEVAYAKSGELFRRAGHASGEASALFRLGVVAYTRGEIDESRRLWDESLRACRSIGDRIGELQAIGNLGQWELEHGDIARGKELIDESLRMAQEAGWGWWEAIHLGQKSEEALAEGTVVEGQRMARRVLALGVEIDDRTQVVYALAMLAWAAFQRGDHDRAGLLCSTVEAQEPGQGRFWVLDRERYGSRMRGVPRASPVALDEAVQLVLASG